MRFIDDEPSTNIDIYVNINDYMTIFLPDNAFSRREYNIFYLSCSQVMLSLLKVIFNDAIV